MSDLEPGGIERPAAVLKFSGGRFNEEGMPTWALSEIVAFQALLTEVAKAQFRRVHSRIRVQAGFDERLTLRLRRIEGGSVTPFMYRPVDAVVGGPSDLFSEIEVADQLDEARSAIEGLVSSASKSMPLPDIFRDISVSVLKKFGQNLVDGEFLQVGANNETATWVDSPKYTRLARQALLLSLTGTYTDSARAIGVIDNLSFGNQNFGVRTEEEGVILAPYTDDEFRTIIRKADSVSTARFLVQGWGEYGADHALRRFLSVDLLEVIGPAEQEPDYERSSSAVSLIEDMRNSWDEEEAEGGKPVEQDQIQRARLLLGLMRSSSLSEPYVYPTELGGLQFEWTHGDLALSLEIRPEDSRFLLQSTNTRTVNYETFKPDGNVDGTEGAIIWLRERLEGDA